MKKTSSVLRLVEGALLIAVATVLSMVKLLDLPYGGSVTACSALPVLLIGYRHGIKFGMFAAFVYSLLQLLLGVNTLSYFSTPLSVVAIILLDYVLAFAVLGFGGVFRCKDRPQGQALVLAALLASLLRYVCHVVSGCTVWAGLSIPTQAALVYSLAYNATYMLPETLVTALGAWYLSRALDVGGERLSRVTRQGLTGRAFALGMCAKGALCFAAVTDVVLVFRHLQDGETGEFLITGLAQVNWLVVVAVSAVGIGLFAVLELIAKAQKER